MFVGQAETFARSIDELRSRLSMRFVSALDLRHAFTNERVSNDELRPSVIALFGSGEGIEKLLHVLAVDFLHIEPVGLEAFSSIFALGFFRRRVEGDGVAIVDQDQIIQTEMCREGACFGGDSFLQATVARQTNNMLIENLVLGGVETRGRHLRRDRNADSVANALPKRSGCTFHTRRFTKFR